MLSNPVSSAGHETRSRRARPRSASVPPSSTWHTVCPSRDARLSRATQTMNELHGASTVFMEPQLVPVQEATAAALAGDARLVAGPVETPWRSLNARFDAPGDLHLTVFEEIDGPRRPDLPRRLTKETMVTSAPTDLAHDLLPDGQRRSRPRREQICLMPHRYPAEFRTELSRSPGRARP
jgi:hypothetical protein